MKNVIIVILSIVAVALTVVSAGLGFAYYKEVNAEDESNDEDTLSALSVIDGVLCNEKERPIQLKGMSTHGITWYPRYTNARALNTLKGYGANVIRIAVYSEKYMSTESDKEEYMNYIYNAIENAMALNMYVILDWHVLKEEDPNVTTDEAKSFFEEISSHYGENPYLLYEICNEPNGDTNWDAVYDYATKIIPAIRANAPEAIIIVGTPNYCQDIEEVAKNPLPYDNVLYALHIYFDLSEEKDNFGTADYYLEKLELGLPIFISEWGLKNTDGELYTDEVDYFIMELKKRHISWCNWSLSNKDESYSFIKSNCEKLSDWEDEDLTPSGLLIKKYLQY